MKCLLLNVTLLFILTAGIQSQMVKPGHYEIKEYHFHVYWLQNNQDQESAAVELNYKIVSAVADGNFTVVCNGVTNDILPQINEDDVASFNTGPSGPHSCGNFGVWVPREFYADFLSFIMLNRGDLTVLIHPLGTNEIEDHTAHATVFGTSYPLDLSVLSLVGGDDPEFPELELGYNAP